MNKNCRICEFNQLQTFALTAKTWKIARRYLTMSYAKQQKIETLHRIVSVNCCSNECTEQAKHMRKIARELESGQYRMLVSAVSTGREHMIRARRKYELMQNYKNINPEHLERARAEYQHKKSVHTQRLRNLNHYVRKSNI